ncbi:MAG TPA: SPOR domain-containing protein [Dongiaceae bacterium]|nr:SPOR domain-containing protein [Dongiaceae bacterium]
MARPANDVRGDPFFRSIQSTSPAEGGGPGGGRAPIPMTPFARMQAPQEPTPTEAPPSDDPESASEPTSAIEIPEMPERPSAPDLVSMPEPVAAAQLAAAAAIPAQPAPAPAAPSSPLSRMMRGTAGETPSPKGPAQRDLLAGLPPPPISEPLTADTESNAMHRRRRNRRLLALAAVVVVAAIGAWLWTGSEKSAEVPVITADATPEKVKPADEGGLQVPNQNVQVLENMSGAPAPSQGETVMPPPEQPVTPPAPGEAQPPSAEQAPTVVENAAPDTNGSSIAPAPSEAPAVDTPPALEAPLATAPLPEQTENAAAEAAAAPPSPQPAPPPAPAAEAAAPAASDQAPAQEPAQATTQSVPAQPAPTPAPAPSATQEAAVTPAAPVGKTRVQLAAGKSEAAVKKEWAALQKAHPDLLGALTLNVERVDKGAAGIFYRLQAGPLADKNAAAKLCASLKQAHQDCIVVR